VTAFDRDLRWRESLVDHLPFLRRYADTLIRHESHIHLDDLVNEVVMRALRVDDANAPRKGHVRGWLFMIMHNCFATRSRSLMNSWAIHVDMSSIPLDVDSGDYDKLVAHLDLRDVKKTMSQLPKLHRHVIILACVEKLKYHEVAKVLGVPVGTVMSRLARAREYLRRQTATERGDYGALRDRKQMMGS
jgi:RNA polymerase sigma-70 factor (ECF subfamily)